MEELVNRVAKSGIVTIDLGDWYPEGKRLFIDVKEQLWQGMALRESDFREHVAKCEWTKYSDAYVGVYCSADAIIPTWAYMLLASELSGIAREVFFTGPEGLEILLWDRSLSRLNPEDFREKRVVVKGCADRPVSPHAFVKVTEKLRPVVNSLMFGEPCSTVPVYKRKKD